MVIMKNGKSKYHSKKVTVDNVTFDSVKEYLRFKELSLLERAGKIQKLERQVRYELIPSQCIGGKVVERPCSYIADFVYLEGDKLIVEDCKGFRTPDYIIKRKLMLKNYGIRIRES
jgi:hypothetical protein